MKRLLLLTIVILVVATLLMLLWRWLSPRPPRLRPAARQPSSTSGLLLLWLPLPVAAAAAVSLARGQLTPFLGDAIGYGLFLGGALLLRRGLAASDRPSGQRWPLKTFGSALIALATGITAWLGVGRDPAIASAFALSALLGCYLTYGFDALAGARLDKGRGPGAHTLDTLARAALSVAAIEQASRDIRQPELDARLRRIAELAREILERLEEDPRDLRRARMFLNVYLDGVQRVVEGYAKTHARIDGPELDERFRRVLVRVEDVFQTQRQTLLESDVDDLDLQIEVLTTQLKQEGIL